MDDARIDLAVLPPPVHAIAAALARSGGRCWLVGGPVRDLLLGQPVLDFDLATDLVPDAVLAALPGANGADRRYGACRVASEVGEVVVTTLRRDAGSTDHRHPDRVEFVTDPGLDARRRDFTVNAIYVDLADGRVFDPESGLADLAARVLRVIGEPAQRFREDALRLLRAVRFAARCELTFAPSTALALRDHAELAATLSAERCYAELTSAFTRRGRGRALRLLVETGLARVLLPEVAAMDGVTQPPEYHPEGDVLTHVCMVLDHVPEGDEVLAWSAVLHDVGKPPTWRQAEDRIRFDGHDTLSATMAEAILQRFHASRAVREEVVDVCLRHIHFAALPGMRPVKAERWLRSPGFRRHLAFHRADCLGSHGDLSIHRFAEQALAALPPERPVLLQGRDVLALGVPPGPEVGRLLAVATARIDELPTPPDRREALALLRDLVAETRQAPDTGAR
jgi:poly(A) polymerase